MSGHQQKRESMAERLVAESGRTLDDWVALLAAAEVEGFSRSIEWLKAEHGLGHFQARLIAEVRRDGAL